MWEKEWGDTIDYSHGCSNSSGVAVLIPPTLGLYFNCDNIDRDNDGHIFLLSCRLEGNIIIIIAIFGFSNPYEGMKVNIVSLMSYTKQACFINRPLILSWKIELTET